MIRGRMSPWGLAMGRIYTNLRSARIGAHGQGVKRKCFAKIAHWFTKLDPFRVIWPDTRLYSLWLESSITRYFVPGTGCDDGVSTVGGWGTLGDRKLDRMYDTDPDSACKVATTIEQSLRKAH